MMRKISVQIRLLARIGFAWHWPSPGCPEGSRLRWLARANRFRRYSLPAQLLLHLGATLLWPVGIWQDLKRVERIRKTRREQGKSFPDGYRSWPAFWFALRHNVLPREYLIYELWKPERQRLIDAFLYSNERLGLMLAFNGKEPTPDPVNDKLALAGLCEENGIAHPKRYAPPPKEIEPVPPKTDLWEKPVTGAQGANHRLWQHLPGGDFTCDDDIRTYAELVQEVRHKGTLLQAKLENHADLQPYSNGALIVVRCVTFQLRNGAVTPLAATVQFPFGDATQSRAGITGRVNLVSGIVEDVRNISPFHESVPVHPDTGADFNDLKLPFWPGLIDAARELHQYIPAYCMVGWDIAVTPLGPVIIEGNASWGSEQHQEPSPDPTPILPLIGQLANKSSR